MNEATLTDPGLPGLQAELSPAAAVPITPKLGLPRVRPVDRSQLTWRVVDVEGLIEEVRRFSYGSDQTDDATAVLVRSR